ncbi:MAG: PEP-CTERM sorting domain-containing protein [Chthoniobacterales bacterium]
MKTSSLLIQLLGLPLACVSAGVVFSNAGTAVTNQGQQTSVAGATTVDFNDVVILSQGTTYVSSNITMTGVTAGSGSTAGTFVQGSVGGQYTTPGGDTSVYVAVGGTGRPGPVTVTFGTAVSYFGFSWTTPDTYNSVQLFNGSTSLGTFVPGTNTPGLTTGSATGYANFNTTGSDVITSAVFSSPNAAFETDNFAYTAVPEPSTIGLAALALCGGGVLYRRKRA